MAHWWIELWRYDLLRPESQNHFFFVLRKACTIPICININTYIKFGNSTDHITGKNQRSSKWNRLTTEANKWTIQWLGFSSKPVTGKSPSPGGLFSDQVVSPPDGSHSGNASPGWFVRSLATSAMYCILRMGGPRALHQGSSVRHPCLLAGPLCALILFRTHCLAVLLGYSSSFANHQPQGFFWLSEKPAGKTLQYPAALEARIVGPSSMQVWFWVLYQASCFGALADMQLMGKFWERLWLKQICFFQIQSVVNQSKLISWKMLEDLYNQELTLS